MLSDGSEISAYAILIASGMQVRQLEAPGVADLVGAGVYYGAALSEAAMYRGKHVYVVGGANSAGQGAMFFSRYAKQVTVLVRGPSLAASMSRYLIDRIEDAKNVDVLSNTVVASVHGQGRLEGITLADAGSGDTREVAADAMFIFIGSAPRTEVVAGLVERDAQGFILTGRDLLVDGKWPKTWTANRDPFLFETSVPGVFAAGDARHGSGKACRGGRRGRIRDGQHGSRVSGDRVTRQHASCAGHCRTRLCPHRRRTAFRKLRPNVVTARLTVVCGCSAPASDKGELVSSGVRQRPLSGRASARLMALVPRPHHSMAAA